MNEPRRHYLLALSLLSCSSSGGRSPASSPPASDPPTDVAHHHAASDDAHGSNGAHDGRSHHRHHRFENAEQWAKKFDDPSRDKWQRPDAVIDFVAPAANARVADIGAGTGYFAIRFARQVPQGMVFANDIEPDMVRYLTKRAKREGLSNLVAVQGSTRDPRLPETIDVAFLCNVYHHIEDPVAFFHVVVSRLQPGGRVIIVDFKKDAPEDIPGPPMAMRVAQDELVANLAPVGLALARADRDRLPYQYILELKRAP
ncbi:MAG: class I SAM-dependent methyltransferase [Myxococcota bacterium]